MRRRTRPRADLFGPPNADHWLVIQNPWHQVIQWSKLPAGLDLLRYFLELLLRYHNEGWKLHEFSSFWAHFYASREGKQHYVQITCADPELPKRTHYNLMDGITNPGTFARKGHHASSRHAVRPPHQELACCSVVSVSSPRPLRRSHSLPPPRLPARRPRLRSEEYSK